MDHLIPSESLLLFRKHTFIINVFYISYFVIFFSLFFFFNSFFSLHFWLEGAEIVNADRRKYMFVFFLLICVHIS